MAAGEQTSLPLVYVETPRQYLESDQYRELIRRLQLIRLELWKPEHLVYAQFNYRGRSQVLAPNTYLN